MAAPEPTAAPGANPTGSTGTSWLMAGERTALDDVQERQLDALFGRILPEDEARGVPGALRARASRFVSLLLARDPSVYEEIVDWRSGYPVWLKALDDHARQQLGKALVELAPAQLDAIVAGLESGTLAGLPATLDQKKVFKTLYRHCIQGCFADPRWGGNPEGLMWSWLGYLQPPREVL